MSTQTVIITGALAGIGRATATAFARLGANLIISGRREEDGFKLAGELQALGANVEFVRVDVRNEDDVQALVDRAVARFGKLDVAVNNAGIEQSPGPTTGIDAATYTTVFDTNVLGTLLSMKHELRVMIPQGHGSIVNVSSTYGRAGAAGAAIYVGSKHAIEGITKAVALEVAESGIRVNVVAPGITDTAMLTRFTKTDAGRQDMIGRVPMKRIGESEEIAEAIVFLASDKASYITGTSLAVDGGKLAR